MYVSSRDSHSRRAVVGVVVGANQQLPSLLLRVPCKDSHWWRVVVGVVVGAPRPYYVLSAYGLQLLWGVANALRTGLRATHVQLAREWVCCKCAVGSGARRRKARSAQMEAPTTQPPADNDCEANAAPSGPQALHTRGGSVLLCSDCVAQKNLVTTMCAFVFLFLKYQLRNCAPVMLQKGTAAYSLHNWQECQATHGRKHCGSYCSLAANYSGGQTNVAHSPRSSWSFNLRKSA